MVGHRQLPNQKERGLIFRGMKILINVVFGVLVILLIGRLAIAINEQGVFIAVEPDSRMTDDKDDQGNVDESRDVSGDPSKEVPLSEVLAALNCSYQRSFVAAAPATRGFTCASAGRKVHPMTVFEYRDGTGLSAVGARTRAAVKKACENGRGEVFVLSQPNFFVYTLSSSAVSQSELAASFVSVATGPCS